jgi:hypothetical protein
MAVSPFAPLPDGPYERPARTRRAGPVWQKFSFPRGCETSETSAPHAPSGWQEFFSPRGVKLMKLPTPAAARRSDCPGASAALKPRRCRPFGDPSEWRR